MIKTRCLMSKSCFKSIGNHHIPNGVNSNGNVARVAHGPTFSPPSVQFIAPAELPQNLKTFGSFVDEGLPDFGISGLSLSPKPYLSAPNSLSEVAKSQYPIMCMVLISWSQGYIPVCAHWHCSQFRSIASING